MNQQSETFNMLKNTFQGKILFTKQEVSEVLGTSLSSVNNYIALPHDSLKYVKLGRTKRSAIRIKLEDLAHFIDAMELNGLGDIV